MNSVVSVLLCAGASVSVCVCAHVCMCMCMHACVCTLCACVCVCVHVNKILHLIDTLIIILLLKACWTHVFLAACVKYPGQLEILKKEASLAALANLTDVPDSDSVTVGKHENMTHSQECYCLSLMDRCVYLTLSWVLIVIH